MKKISILSLHLGYGGVEKSIAALANVLCKNYEVEIICIYQLYEKPAFTIDERVKITYLIHSDLPVRVEKYKLLLFRRQFTKLLKQLTTDYFSKFKFALFPISTNAVSVGSPDKVPSSATLVSLHNI